MPCCDIFVNTVNEDMENYMWLWIFCWASVIIFPKSTKAECEDAGGRHCKKNKCTQPGYAHHCKKTCGRCENVSRCQHGYYNMSNGTCVSCTSVFPIYTNLDTYNDYCGNTCPRGLWGDSCTNNCNIGCNDYTCVSTTGACHKGCKPCYEGRWCDSVGSNCNCNSTGCACKVGYFGNRCLEKCSSFCNLKVCINDGTCNHGCIPGWYGPKCDKACPNCRNGTCSFNTGSCTDGCIPGLYGIKCSKNCGSDCLDGTCQIDGRCDQCPSGQFGDTCDKDCPVNCGSEFCDQNGGSCFSCKAGFHGDHCKMSCPDNCNTLLCDQYNGSCQRCKVGYKGSHCNISCLTNCTVCDQYGDRCTSCKHGLYGHVCDGQCNTCLENDCNITGKCIKGCKDGWFGDRCERKCNSGCNKKFCNRDTGRCSKGCIATVYGAFCNNSCSTHCYQKRCHTRDNGQTNRTCTVRCKDGWSGDYCDVKCPHNCLKCVRSTGSCLECSDHRYGEYCNQTCSQNCLNSTCNMTGFCSMGCYSSTWGSLCEKNCSYHCPVCDRETGHCDQCEGSYYGHHCTETCSSGCMNSQCNISGFCTGGCQDGRHGKTCSDNCDFRCRTCRQLTGQCLSCVHGWTGARCMDSLLSSMKNHIWILTASLCIVIFLAIIILIRRKYLSSCISRWSRDIYSSPIPNNGSDLPLQDVYASGGHSDHPYASIEDEYEFSGGSIAGNNSDRSYEPVERPQLVHFENSL